MPKRIALFNHKGGTGKTVSTYNIGWKLTELGYRVLLVDGDSQVNLTALALGFDRFDEYYEAETTKKKNIKDAVSPVFEGKPSAIEAFDCPTAINNSGMFVLPGHADLSTYEGQISLAQETGGSLSVLKNLPGALQSFISEIEDHHKIDFTLIDLNPGLGALNQNFFLACDAFVVPTNPDPFSLMAISTLSSHLVRWLDWKNANLEKFADADYTLREPTPIFLGTLNSRFNKHASKAAAKFDRRIQEIDKRVSEVLFPALKKAGMVAKEECYKKAHDEWVEKLTNDNTGHYALARIPDFQSLIHTANLSGLPVFKLNKTVLSEDKVVGAAAKQALKNIKAFDLIYAAIASKIILLVQDDCRES